MHRILFGIVLALIVLPAWAQQMAPGWIADPRTGCRMWDNYLSPTDRIAWDGPCVGGYGEGRGVLHFLIEGQPDEEVDSGNYKQGKLEGHGVAVNRRTGRSFDGEFHNNKPNGQGTLHDADGQTYTGTWVNGCFNQGGRHAHFFTTVAECG